MLINSIVPILSKATDNYLAMLSRLVTADVYGISCGDEWETAFKMNSIINTLSVSYSNSLISISQVPQLTSDQYECLLSQLTYGLKVNSGNSGDFNSDFSDDFSN